MRSALFALVVVGAALWFWVEARRHHEQALRIVRKALSGRDAQLLDDTVSLQSLGFARNPDGRLGLRRTYGFEVSFDRVTRQRGRLTLIARTIQILDLPEPVEPGVGPSGSNRWH